jgi:hypothetical protein
VKENGCSLGVLALKVGNTSIKVLEKLKAFILKTLSMELLVNIAYNFSSLENINKILVHEYSEFFNNLAKIFKKTIHEKYCIK